MSKFKVGDKVVTLVKVDYRDCQRFCKGTVGVINKIDADGILKYKVCISDLCYYWYAEDELEPYKSYEDGLNEAWELVSKLCDYAPEVRADIFNYDNIKNTSIKNIIRDHYPQEVASMIEEYELVRNFKVGDVVSGVDDEIGIVTRAAANGVGPYIMWSDGSCGVQEYVGDLKKTGQNLDISGLLKSIEKKEN